MSCGGIVDFRGGKAGLVRMEFGAKSIPKFIHPGRLGGKYVPQRFIIEVVFECLCPAKIHPANGFSEKKIGQVCPAKMGLGRLIRKASVERFDWAIAV
jgi:hypothetical protein